MCVYWVQPDAWPALSHGEGTGGRSAPSWLEGGLNHILVWCAHGQGADDSQGERGLRTQCFG